MTTALIQAGHVGYSTGNTVGGVTEASLTSQVANAASSWLNQHGATAYLEDAVYNFTGTPLDRPTTPGYNVDYAIYIHFDSNASGAAIVGYDTGNFDGDSDGAYSQAFASYWESYYDARNGAFGFFADNTQAYFDPNGNYTTSPPYYGDPYWGGMTNYYGYNWAYSSRAEVVLELGGMGNSQFLDWANNSTTLQQMGQWIGEAILGYEATLSPANHPPVVTTQNVTVSANQSVAASGLIYLVTDQDGDSVSQFAFWDSGGGGGYFTLNDSAQPSGQWIYVATGSLGTLRYVGGSSAGSETIYVAAFDGHDWSASAAATATTTVSSVPGSVSISDVTISEGNSGTKVATFTVTRSGGTAAFVVNYATSDGGAVAGSDYVATSGTLSFGTNINSQTISVTINSDTAVESDEAFYVNLSGATNGATISDSLGIGTITNDDAAPLQPDLTASNVSVSDTTPEPSQNVTVSYRINNIGSATAGQSAARVYLSADPAISSADDLLYTQFIDPLSPNSFATDSVVVTMPSTLVAGTTYYIGVIADDTNWVAEANESNNASTAVAVTVGALSQPDLTASNVSVSDTTPEPSQNVTVSYRINNIGSATAGQSAARVYLSTDPAISSADDLLYTQFINPLSPNSFATDSVVVTMPSTLVAGTTYYIGVIADETNWVAEANESNNASTSVAIITASMNHPPNGATLSFNEVAENAAISTIVGTVTGQDPDAGATFSYSLQNSAGGRFAINASTGQLTVANGSLLDFESATSHAITVRVTDQGGLFTDVPFTINVGNVNDAPAGAALSSNTVAENAANGTVVGTVTGQDPDAGATFTYSLQNNAGGRFAINASTGEITVASGSLLNYESATSHVITVRVTDQGGLFRDVPFTINVGNVNEAPTAATLSANTVAENTAIGTVVGTVTGQDPDLGNTLSYSLQNNASDRFAIDSSNGRVTVADGSLLDYESATSHVITVRVTDQGGLYKDILLTINVTNVNDSPPTITSNGGGDADVIDVVENTAGIIATVAATDADAGTTLAYSIVGGVDQGKFQINAVTGALSFKQAPDFEMPTDSDGDNSFVVQVQASDGEFADTQLLTIAVTNLAGVTIEGTPSNDTINSSKSVVGQPFPTQEEDTISGGAGNDLIDALGGNDLVEGGAGNDTLIGGANGAAGDTVSYEHADIGVKVSLALTTAQNTIGAGTDTIKSFENLTGSDFNDTLTGSISANVISGGGGDDLIKGGAGADQLHGGANSLTGGDTLSYAGSNAGVTINLGTGSASGGHATGDTFDGFENILGSAKADTLTGDDNANVIEGGAGNDLLHGGLGADTVSYASATAGVKVSLANAAEQNTVGAGKDTLSGFENLTGSKFSDTLTGDDFANVLTGGLGADKLTGGVGADTFVFNALAEKGDHIIGFESTDEIHFKASGFAGTEVGVTNFVSATGAAPVAGAGTGWFLYDEDDGKLYFDADGAGGAAKVLLLTLDGHPSLAADDLLIV